MGTTRTPEGQSDLTDDAVEPGPLRLLAVEDDPTDSDWLSHLLRQSSVCPYHLSFVTNLSDAQMSLQVGEVDCVLLDLSLPDSWGLDSLRRLLASAPDVPVVVITGTDEQGQGLAAIELGAHDYLEKGKVSGDAILRAARWAAARTRAVRLRAATGSGGTAGAGSGVGVDLTALAVPWLLLDDSLVVVGVSPPLLDLLTRVEGEVLGSSVTGLVAPADVAATLRTLLEVVTGGRPSALVRARLVSGIGDEVARALVAVPSGPGVLVLALDP